MEGENGRSYYQVVESVIDPHTLERELASLKAIRDNYPKYLITLDDVEPTDHDEIQQIYAPEWLANVI